MKRLLAMLLILGLTGACALAEAPAALRYGYIAPYQGETGRSARTGAAFAYAAQRQGIHTVILQYDPGDVPGAAGAAAASGDEQPIAVDTPIDAVEEQPDPAAQDPVVRALGDLIAEGIDGVIVLPASLEQAVRLIDAAQAAGVPIVIEGVDLSPAYPPDPDPDNAEDRPYVAAVTYGDAAGYAAAMWLEEYADSPLMLHCSLDGADPAIRAGIDRALAGASYLELADEVPSGVNTPEAGRDAVGLMFNSYSEFYCVLADSAPLAEGCAAALREAQESKPIAAIDSSAEALTLLQAGTIDALVATPASVEGVQSFKALHDFVTEGIVPEGECRLVALPAVVVTARDSSAWVADDDYEAAYLLAYPEEAGAPLEAE